MADLQHLSPRYQKLVYHELFYQATLCGICYQMAFNSPGNHGEHYPLLMHLQDVFMRSRHHRPQKNLFFVHRRAHTSEYPR